MSVAAGPTRGALVAELAEVVGAPHEARFIVDEVLGLGLVLGLPNVPTGPLDDDTVAAARHLAERRAAGGPRQYVFGHWPFRGLDLVVDRRVLIPRPETEQVAEVALAEARRLGRGAAGAGVVAVDAGTGTGAGGLAGATAGAAGTGVGAGAGGAVLLPQPGAARSDPSRMATAPYAAHAVCGFPKRGTGLVLHTARLVFKISPPPTRN